MSAHMYHGKLVPFYQLCNCKVCAHMFHDNLARSDYLFYTFLKSGIDKSTEWSTIPACLALCAFFNRGDTEGTNSSKMLCPMFVYVLFYVYSCRD